jgi:hypothetical protein
MSAVTDGFSKVPEVTIGFWLIKIAATTLGETGGDTVTMTLNRGYLAGTALFLPRSLFWSSHKSWQIASSPFSIGRGVFASTAAAPRPASKNIGAGTVKLFH